MNWTVESPPTKVPATAKQVGDVRARWAWTEPAVWTDCMLTALENGVKGGVWFSLMDKVYSLRNLMAAYGKVAANRGAAGVDHVTVQHFGKDVFEHVDRIVEQLRTDTYRPQAIRRTYIPKPGTSEQRPLGIPTVRDRVVQAAVRHVLEPIFEREFADHSYGFRPGRGCKQALRRVDALLKQGFRHVVDVDLKSYFDTIPHDKLMALLRTRIADSRVLKIVERFLKARILDDLKTWTPEQGAPQGAVLSPLLSNIYLNPLDHLMASQGFAMTRYADDLIIQCRTREEAEAALAVVRQWTAEAGLTLHPTKTKIVEATTEGFEFLGYRFEKHRRFPRAKSLAKFKDAIRAKTRRTNGRNLHAIITDVNRTLRGWFEYFKHSYHTTFASQDGWVRRRMRSILRSRHRHRGLSGGRDHQRWPNAYFIEQGLYTLESAHARACQPSAR